MAKDYITPGVPITLQTLAHALSQIASASNKTPNTGTWKALTDSISAVAILIKDYATQQVINEIVTSVKAQLQEHLESFTNNVETMRDAVEHVTGAAKEITGKMNDFNEGFHESAEQLVQATQELTEKTTDTTKGTTNKNLVQCLETYASATKQHVPPAHEAIVAKGYQSAKQIIIRKDPKSTDNALDSLSELELVAKANTAIGLMGTDNFEMPPDTAFVGAKKLRNGNVMYLLNTYDAGRWINETEVQKAFIESYGGTSNIQSNVHYVIAEFVPITFTEDSTFTHAKIEENSGLSYNTITYSKYIKPAHLRTKNQKVAHVIFGFKDRHTANTAIQAGLIVEGKHVNVRKKLTEPKRCLKCQKFGHYVADCSAEKDTCARCKASHRTSTCDITDTAHFNCSNCIGANAKGHGAADRNCPAFITEAEKVHSRIPDNKYKYFPTEESKTWKLLNDTDDYTEQRPQNTAAQHTNNQPEGWQTTHRGRPYAPLTQQDRHYRPRPKTDTYIPDEGWPIRPAQTTLDGYIDNTQGSARDKQTAGNAPNQQNNGEPTPTADNNPRSSAPPPTIQYA